MPSHYQKSLVIQDNPSYPWSSLVIPSQPLTSLVIPSHPLSSLVIQLSLVILSHRSHP